MKKQWIVLLAIVLAAGLFWAGFAYFNFVSRTIYEESTAHLTEIFHQANQALHNLVSVNWSRMRMWVPYLEAAESEADIASYVNQAREESNFTNFYFISRNGSYLTLAGQSGYLDLRDQLADLILENKPVVANSVVPDKPEIMVFAVPAAQGCYRGFDYEAIAVTFSNSDLVEALKISAFNGDASTFAVLPDGRIVVNNGSENLRNTHNFLALLEKYSSLSDAEIAALHEDFLSGRSDALVFRLNGSPYYLVYESANFQDWTVLGVVPANVVNANMNRLQSSTMIVVSGITLALAVMLLLFVIQHNRQKMKQKDHALVARDELFSKLSSNVDDVFLMLDAQKLTVDYVSPNVEKLLGISEAEVRKNAHVMERVVRENETPHILERLSGIHLGEQMEWDREFIHQLSSEVRWFHIIALFSDIHGEKKYILDMSDRTDDRKIHQALEDAVHTAENASRAKTIFLNNISHDIRTPMNAIIGFTSIALKRDPAPEVRTCLHKIRNSAEHLLTLINDVLDISRIESGKMKSNPVPVDIMAVTDTVLNIVHGYLTDRHITFHTNLAVPETPYVLADSVCIRGVLVNILSNAVKFTEDGGSISFETSYCPGIDERHIIARYRVSDTGVGMSEEYVKHIFDEFSQEKNEARTHYKGTGLGMAITKQYVDLMGGTISVESRKGLGSTFIVELTLELTDERNVQRQTIPVAKADLMGVKVLLAEDNDLNAEIAMVQLEELGIQVTRVSHGREAVQTFADNPPDTFDVILMDIMMPEMNGYEATAAIRATPNRPDARWIPIIAMTANAFTEDIQASLDAGMNGHLSKPIVVEEVVEAINRNRNKNIRPA